MKKKKVYLIVAISLLAFYCLSIYTSFCNERSAIGKQFMNFYERIIQSADGENCNVDEYLEYYSTLSDNYPTLLSVYDFEGNLVRQSGSFIRFISEGADKELYIYLDEYLDSSTKQKLTDLQKQKDYYTIENLEYVIKSDEIIPISMVMVNSNNPLDKITVPITDKEKIAPNSEQQVSSEIINYSFIDIDENSIDHKTYDKMRKEHDEYTLYIKENLEEIAYGGSECYGIGECCFKGVIVIPGEMYFINLTSEIRPVLYTLKSAQFWHSVETQTIYIAVLAIALFIAVNKLYKKSARMEESKQSFTSAAAHELKTPLAVIQNQCECVIENISPQKNGEYISSIYAESLRMNKLVATLLQYNRIASADRVDKEKCSLSDIISNEVEKYKSFAKAKNIEIHSEICDNATVVCNSELISLVVDNFLSNAVKHSYDNCPVTVRLIKVKNKYKVSIYNKGKGINPEYRKNLWDVFYREDKARNSSDNSTGMGLAICKQILELHKYKYGFEHIDGGVEFYFITD
ncbi:MAG: HAMP domain-containing histidine kinase [Eubacterium sp.]|nr:HAMP domain-containing histidine kinase [Eubacterium sp.]